MSLLFLCSETVKWHWVYLAFVELAVFLWAWAWSFRRGWLLDNFLCSFYLCYLFVLFLSIRTNFDKLYFLENYQFNLFFTCICKHYIYYDFSVRILARNSWHI